MVANWHDIPNASSQCLFYWKLSAPQSKNAVSAFYITRRVLSSVSEKFLKWLADDQSSFITKGSIYYVKHVYLQPFCMEVDWQEIWHQMDICFIFVDTAFLLYGADMVGLLFALPVDDWRLDCRQIGQLVFIKKMFDCRFQYNIQHFYNRPSLGGDCTQLISVFIVVMVILLRWTTITWSTKGC